MTRAIIGISIAVALQIGLLVSIIAERVGILATGTPMSLLAQPVDPRDFFRGDYVVLKYEISSFHATELSFPKDLKIGQDIWVVMVPENTSPQANWYAESLLSHYDPALAGRLIKGTITQVSPVSFLFSDNINIGPKACENRDCRFINVDYGIGKYFLPEGTGKALEKARDAKTLSVLIAASNKGTATIIGLKKNGTLLYEETLF